MKHYWLGVLLMRELIVAKTRRIAAVAAALLLSCSVSWGGSADEVFHPLNLNSPAVVAHLDKQADAILRQLTLEQKIQLMADPANQPLMTAGIKSAGVPALKTSDASLGIVDWGPSTAYPASVALAASWDQKLAYLTGRSIGRDARARGVYVVFGPGLNIAREPQCGRNFEYLGEDPCLTGRMGVEWIKGLQSMRVAACAKHYAVNEQETDRQGINMVVGARALQEIYLPPFRDAVKEGDVMMIMCAYNQVNGQFCTANRFLLTTMLRDRWGFKGQTRSDYGATHDTLGPLIAGLDFENPGAKYYNAKAILPLLQSGKITEQTIDTHVRRLLRLIIAMDFVKGTQRDTTIPLDDPHSRAIAMREETEGTVLLKNANGILPLQPSRLKTIVMVGPNTSVVPCGWGSSHVTPVHKQVTMVEAIRTAAGPDVRVIYLPYPAHTGLYTHSDYLPIQGVKGLEGVFYRGTNFSGSPVAQQLAKQIDFNWQLAPPVPQISGGSPFSVRWVGQIRSKQTGQYVFSTGCDDGAKVYLDGKKILDNWGPHPMAFKETTLRLTGGKTYNLRIDYYNLGGIARMSFGWQPLALVSRRDADILRRASVVIACVGPHETEGKDRPFELPDGQDAYLHKVSSLNRHTIVVVNAGDNVAMSDWIHQVAGLIYAWYPGENGNTAVARIIFGQIDPSGRLPVTLAKRWKDCPAYGHFPGKNGMVNLAEGIYVGYRWFDKKHVQPRYPFGYGLSYTRFKLSHLVISSRGTGRRRIITAQVTVTNTGHRSGAEVVQLYIHPPQGGPVDRCVQKLCGFARTELDPGQSKTVSVKLYWRDFAYFDTQANQWKLTPGKYEIAAGSDSRDEPLVKRVSW